MEKEKILSFLKWNDRNADLDNITYEESIMLFYQVVNDDFFYNIEPNILVLVYEEVINYAKDGKIYKRTENKLKSLINGEINDFDLYNKIIEK